MAGRVADMPLDALGYVVSVEETYDPPTVPLDENGQGQPYAVYGYGAHMAEVQVDLRFGTVKVLELVAAHDLGRTINPMLAEGQSRRRGRSRSGDGFDGGIYSRPYRKPA